MANRLNESSVRTLKGLVRDGKVNKSSGWNFTSNDMDELRGGDEGDNWERVENAHLAIETEAEEKTQSRFAFPVAKLTDDGLTVFRSGVIAAKQRAGQTDDKSIENAADNLLQLLGDEEEESSAEEYADKLTSIPNVEIFKKGIWKGKKFTEDDLDEIVNNFGRVGFTPPVKLGHTRDPSARAFGKVQNVRKEGDTIIADFQDVPFRIADTIKEKGFDSVSVEMHPELERNGKKLGRTLMAAALLGAHPPAVDGLKPVSESVQFNEEEVDVFVYNQDKEIDDMSEETKEQDNQDLQQLREEKEQLEKELKEYKENYQEGSKVSEDLQETKKQLAQLQEQRRKDEVEALSSKVNIPSVRPYVEAFADWATLQPSDQTYNFSEGEQTVEKHPKDIVTDFIEHINQSSQWIFKEHSSDSTIDSRDAAEKGAGEKLDELTQQRMSNQGEDYAEAFNNVLSENPQLASEYAQT